MKKNHSGDTNPYSSHDEVTSDMLLTITVKVPLLILRQTVCNTITTSLMKNTDNESFNGPM